MDSGAPCKKWWSWVEKIPIRVSGNVVQGGCDRPFGEAEAMGGGASSGRIECDIYKP